MNIDLDIGSLTPSELEELDLTLLTASQLVEYGDIAKWTTEELEEALLMREMYNSLGRQSSMLRELLENPKMKSALKVIDKGPKHQNAQSSRTHHINESLADEETPNASRNGAFKYLIKLLFRT